MIQPPSTSDFVLTLPDNFIYKEIIERYDPYFKQNNWLFLTLNDFVSSFVVRVGFPGITTPVNEQSKGPNHSSPRYRSGISSKEQVNKELSITFRMSAGYINYFILLDQLMAYVDSTYNSSQPQNTGNDTFLPDITLFILNEEGNIAFERVYKGIVFSSIDELSLNKEELLVRDLEFTCRFSYSDWTLKNNISQEIDITNPKFVY